MRHVSIIACFVLFVFLQIITIGAGNRLNAEISNNQYETPADTIHCRLLYQTTAVKERQNGKTAYGKRNHFSEVGCDYYKDVGVMDIERTALKWDISRIPLYPNIKIVSADFKFNSGFFPKKPIVMKMRNISEYLDPDSSKDAQAIWNDCGDGEIYDQRPLDTLASKYPVDFNIDEGGFLQEIKSRLGNWNFICGGFRADPEDTIHGYARVDPNEKMVVSYSLLITISGSLQNDESWIKTVNLTGDVYVPDGVTLTFEDGVIVNLNGHKITKNWAGNIVFNENVTINPDIRLMRSGEIMGFYSSTQQALGDAQSTDEIDLRGNISWTKNMTITSDIKVMSGSTLNIAGGKTINFDRNRKLIVNGHLATSGSAGNEVIFTSSVSSPGSWAGIWMEGGQFSGHFEHNIVQYATYGLKLSSGSGGTIQNCTIQHNNWGIYLYNSGVTYIEDNIIENNTQAGITSYYGELNIYNNTSIQNSGADALQFQNTSPDVYGNTIKGNYRGVVTSGSTVDMGYDCNHGGYNSIYNNSSYEIYESNGLIYAQNNWWGFSGIPWGDFYQGGTILCWCYLNSNPNLSKPMGDFPNKTAYYPEIKQLIYGINLRKEGNYVSAYNIMKNLFSEYYNSIYAPYILMEIHKTYWKAKLENSIIKESSYLNYLSSIETEYGPASQKFNNEVYAKALQLEASELIRTRNWIAAKEKLTQLKEAFPNSAAEEEALFDLIMVYLEGFDNEEAAHSTLALLEGKYPESIFILHGKVAVGETLTSKQLGRHWQPFSKGFRVEMSNVKNFNLISAYPNPFNPTTTIRYQLPETQYVTVAIYDVQGRLVEMLVDGEKVAGRYSVQWHASNIPSGVYFYRIQAGKFTATKKLLLLK